MKFYFTLFFLTFSLIIFGAESHLTDIRFGSYNNKELILAKNKNANKTRFIFESDKKLVYVTKFENNKFFIEISNCQRNPKSGKYKINNGLVSELLFNNIKNNISIIIKFEGTYRKSKIFSVKNPNRLILDLYGTPNLKLKKEPILKPKSTSQKKNNKTISFKNSEKLYLNLNDVPIRNIIKFFSDSCKDDIIADNSVRGKASLSIKNQTLKTAFDLFLISENLELINREGIFLVKKFNSEVKENSGNSILIKYANPQNICKILNNKFGTNDFLTDDLNHSIIIPKNIDTKKIADLIKKYDRLISRKVNFISGFISVKDLTKISLNNEKKYALLDKNKTPLIRYQSKISQNLYSSITNKIDFSKNKFINSGFIFPHKISIKSGPEIAIKYFGENDIFSSLKINWNILTKKYSKVVQDKIYIENPDNKNILIWNNSFTKNLKFDNWNFDNISYLKAKKMIPVILIEFEKTER